ncbi:MAG: SGNH/GDSL hydrolase family protein [Alphaproteobacteria bacterium]
MAVLLTGQKTVAVAGALVIALAVAAGLGWLQGRGVFSDPGLAGPRRAKGDQGLAARLDASPDRPAIVTLLGASLSARGAWPDRLAEGLSRCRPGGVTVRRVARVGMSSRWGRAQIDRALRPDDGAPPDILIVHFTGNDAALHRGVSLAESEANHTAILDEAQAAGVLVYLALLSPAEGVRGWARPGQAGYAALYRHLAARSGAGLIDALPLWHTVPRARRKAWLPDGLHPTDTAHAAITEPVVGNAIAKALTQKFCPETPQ